jgi:stage II sporulation protein D
MRIVAHRLKIRILIPTLAIFFASPAYSAASEFRIRLFESRGEVRSLVISGPCEILRPNQLRLEGGTHIVTVKPGGSLGIANGAHHVFGGRSILLRGVGEGPVHLRCGTTVRSYLGQIEITPQVHGRGLKVVNTIDRMNYVQSVVGSEIQPLWSTESIKAMAVLIQTSIAGQRSDEEIGDSTQKRVYFGSDYVSPKVRDAVSSVWGETLCYRSDPISVFYHPTCAGRTSSGVSVFGKPAQRMAYLQSVECDYCKDAPFWKPTITHIYASKFDTAFGEALPVVKSVDEADRPVEMQLTRQGRRSLVSGYQFWTELGQRFGWDKAPGLRFSLIKVGDKIEVKSTGAGHGVGLCQWGAERQAKLGRTYKQILQYYFPGTALRKG